MTIIKKVVTTTYEVGEVSFNSEMDAAAYLKLSKIIEDNNLYSRLDPNRILTGYTKQMVINNHWHTFKNMAKDLGVEYTGLLHRFATDLAKEGTL
nr:hypothetical protein [uncultured Cohaesibacter sp.]